MRYGVNGEIYAYANLRSITNRYGCTRVEAYMWPVYGMVHAVLESRPKLDCGNFRQRNSNTGKHFLECCSLYKCISCN